MKFEDTQLLDHPTIRKAFDEVQRLYPNDDDFIGNAIKGGELISEHAKNLDPDAVAATVLQGAMVIPYNLDSFSVSISPGAVAILETFRKLSVTKPVFATEGERQFMLAQNVGALEGLTEKIRARDIFKYKDTKKMIEANEGTLEAAAQGMADQHLADIARDRLDTARDALETLRRTTGEDLKFEKSGLPNHPTVKQAYALIRTDESKYDPLFTNRTELGAGIAKVLFETGGSTDPDVLGAAILNQYTLAEGRTTESPLKDYAAWLKLKEAGLADLRQKFPARMVEIYLETSPFGNESIEKKRQSSEEATLISAAMRVYLLETSQQEFIAQAKLGDEGYAGPAQLETIEDYAKTLTKLAQKITQPGLKARMEKSVAAAKAFMNQPANVAIRKPGSPRIDYGW